MPLVLGLAIAACTPVTGRQAERAEDACREEARDDGFNNIRVTSGAVGFGDMVSLDLRAERNGDVYTGDCTYDRDSRRAEIDLKRGGGDDRRLVERARDACREEARDRNFNIRDTSDVRVQDDRVRLTMKLRRDGRDYRGSCRFERGNANLEVERS